MSIAYAPTVLADNPVAYWRLGEAVGASSAVDASGNGINGAYTGGYTLDQAGAVSDGNASALLNSTTGYVAVPHSVKHQFGTAMSMELWFKAAANAEVDARLISKRDAGATPMAYEMYIISGTGVIQMFVGDGVTIAFGTLNSVRTGLLDSQWHHAVFTRSGTTAKLYLDGVIDGTYTGLPSGSTTPTTPLTMGRYSQGSIRFLNGQIDEVALYGVSLSAVQVAAHYAAGQPFRAALARGSNAYIGPNVPPGAMNA